MSVNMSDKCGAAEEDGGDNYCKNNANWLFPTGINTKLYCPSWKDRGEVHTEVNIALDLCIQHLDEWLFTTGWLGVGLWSSHNYVSDYMTRV